MRKEFLKNVLLCAIAAALFFFVLFSFREDKKASLQFTKDQYIAVQSRLFNAVKTIDSLKIAMHYSSMDAKLNVSAERTQQELSQVFDFIGQMDSVFNPKGK